MINKGIIKRAIKQDKTISVKKQEQIWNYLNKKIGNVDQIRSRHFENTALGRTNKIELYLDDYVAHRSSYGRESTNRCADKSREGKTSTRSSGENRSSNSQKIPINDKKEERSERSNI